MTVRIDDRDSKILKILQSHGRISKAELAKQINLSASACWERVRRLERLGVIEGYRAVVCEENQKRASLFIVQIELENHRLSDFEAFESAVSGFDEIIECVAVGGGIDYFLRIQTASVETYQEIIDQLLATALGIKRYYTYAVTRQVR